MPSLVSEKEIQERGPGAHSEGRWGGPAGLKSGSVPAQLCGHLWLLEGRAGTGLTWDRTASPPSWLPLRLSPLA